MTVKTINPANGQVEYTLELMDSAAVESILAASASAFPAWSSRPLVERGELLRKVGVQLRTRREDIQKIMTAEMGKLRKEALAEIDKCADACDYYATHAAGYLKDQPIAANDPPEGMVKVAVSAGGRLLPGGSGGITEYVKAEDLERMESVVDVDQEQQDATPDEESFDIF